MSLMSWSLWLGSASFGAPDLPCADASTALQLPSGIGERVSQHLLPAQSSWLVHRGWVVGEVTAVVSDALVVPVQLPGVGMASALVRSRSEACPVTPGRIRTDASGATTIAFSVDVDVDIQLQKPSQTVLTAPVTVPASASSVGLRFSETSSSITIAGASIPLHPSPAEPTQAPSCHYALVESLDGPLRPFALALLTEIGWHHLDGKAQERLLTLAKEGRLTRAEARSMALRRPDFHPTETALLVMQGTSPPHVHLDGFAFTGWTKRQVTLDPGVTGTLPTLALPATDLALLSVHEEALGLQRHYWVTLPEGATIVLVEGGDYPRVSEPGFPNVCVTVAPVENAEWRTGFFRTIRSHPPGVAFRLRPTLGQVLRLFLVTDDETLLDEILVWPAQDGALTAELHGNHIRLRFRPGRVQCD